MKAETKALQAKLQAAMELMDWLLEQSFSSLFPGACYQRKRASLDLLRLMYENLTGGKETNPKNASSPLPAGNAQIPLLPLIMYLAVLKVTR